METELDCVPGVPGSSGESSQEPVSLARSIDYLDALLDSFFSRNCDASPNNHQALVSSLEPWQTAIYSPAIDYPSRLQPSPGFADISGSVGGTGPLASEGDHTGAPEQSASVPVPAEASRAAASAFAGAPAFVFSPALEPTRTDRFGHWVPKENAPATRPGLHAASAHPGQHHAHASYSRENPPAPAADPRGRPAAAAAADMARAQSGAGELPGALHYAGSSRENQWDGSRFQSRMSAGAACDSPIPALSPKSSLAESVDLTWIQNEPKLDLPHWGLAAPDSSATPGSREECNVDSEFIGFIQQGYRLGKLSAQDGACHDPSAAGMARDSSIVNDLQETSADETGGRDIRAEDQACLGKDMEHSARMLLASKAQPPDLTVSDSLKSGDIGTSSLRPQSSNAAAVSEVRTRGLDAVVSGTTSTEAKSRSSASADREGLSEVQVPAHLVTPSDVGLQKVNGAAEVLAGTPGSRSSLLERLRQASLKHSSSKPKKAAAEEIAAEAVPRLGPEPTPAGGQAQAGRRPFGVTAATMLQLHSEQTPAGGRIHADSKLLAEQRRDPGTRGASDVSLNHREKFKPWQQARADEATSMITAPSRRMRRKLGLGKAPAASAAALQPSKGSEALGSPGSEDRSQERVHPWPVESSPVLTRGPQHRILNRIARQSREVRLRDRIISQLMDLAAAYQGTNMDTAQQLFFKLRGVASPSGTSLQRVVHYTLSALAIRFPNTGLKLEAHAEREPSPEDPPQEMEAVLSAEEAMSINHDSVAAAVKVFTSQMLCKNSVYALPGEFLVEAPKARVIPEAHGQSALILRFFVPEQNCAMRSFGFFAEPAMTRALETALLGREKVHIIMSTHGVTPNWASLFQALIDHCHRDSLRVRLTFLIITTAALDEPAAALEQRAFLGLLLEATAAAAQVGLTLQCTQVVVSRHGFRPPLLHIEPDESVAVATCTTFNRLPDHEVLESNPRDALLKWIWSLSPVVVSLVEWDVDFSSQPFLERFKGAIRSAAHAFGSLDPIFYSDKTLYEMLAEEGYEKLMAQGFMQCISYDGMEREFRPEAALQWRERMQKLGFIQDDLGAEVLGTLRGLSVPPHMSIAEAHGAVCLLSNGYPFVFASSWRMPC